MTTRLRCTMLMALAVFLFASAGAVRADDSAIKVTVAQVDYVARTLTATVANLDHSHQLRPPRVWLAGTPLPVLTSSINEGMHTGTLTVGLPNPVPVGSFLLEISWGKDRDDDDHTFEVAIGSTGPQGP